MLNLDFAMTYPCYFMSQGENGLESIVSEGDRCLCLFTDRHLVDEFYLGKYGGQFVSRTIDLEVCDSKEALLNTLADWKPQLATQGVSHLALDVTPNKQVLRVSIDEFILEIERHP